MADPGQGGVEELRAELARRTAEAAELRARLHAAEDAEHARRRVIGNVAHELRTPLSSIIGFASLLERHNDTLPPRERADYLGVVLRSARHLLHVVNDILNISKAEAGVLEVTLVPLRVGEEAQTVITALAPQANARPVHIRLRDQARQAVLADSGRVRQVLFNLLENAIKYSPPGSPVEVRVLDAEGEVRVEVADQGPGISRADQERLFKEFSRVNLPGTRIVGAGLGLALSRMLTELMGGRIGVESHPGRGSTFWIALPASHAPAAAAPAEAAPAAPHRVRGETVAVVEDDPDIRAYAAAVLTGGGYRAVACDASEGLLDRLEGEAPSLVLLDLNLGARSGVDVLREVRARPALAAVPVLAFTASPDVSVERLREQGFAGRIVKPVEPDDLLARVDEALGGLPASSPGPAGGSGDENPGDRDPGDSRSRAADAGPGDAVSGDPPPADARPGDGVAADPPPADARPTDARSGDALAGGGDAAAGDAGDDDDFMAPLRARFRAGLGGRLIAMEAARGAGDRATLTREVHKLRGAALGYGLEELGHLAGAAEEALKTDDPGADGAVARLIDRLRAESDAT
ncbi:MAG TPA: ATP-binding protein [Longimicrobium sp.]|nr:ATP-binding protein [Longimicrobium sp.]